MDLKVGDLCLLKKETSYMYRYNDDTTDMYHSNLYDHNFVHILKIENLTDKIIEVQFCTRRNYREDIGSISPSLRYYVRFVEDSLYQTILPLVWCDFKKQTCHPLSNISKIFFTIDERLREVSNDLVRNKKSYDEFKTSLLKELDEKMLILNKVADDRESYKENINRYIESGENE